ncbi:MAG TPA: recombinase family protein [Bryobacteraceae bacterium]|nr:recombinase family protein [Bryobacteraceae bacterium]
MMKYVRDHVQHPVSLDYFQERSSAGWKIEAVEWSQDDGAVAVEGGPAGVSGTGEEAAPYGLEVVSESLQLKQNPREIAVLMTILEMVVSDNGVPLIAEELNQRGYRTRRGTRWTAPAVFDLLPRMIEMGPQLLTTADWQARRSHLSAPV